MDNETERRRTSFDNEQRRIAFEHEHEERQRHRREDDARKLLQDSEKFQRLLAADREMDDQHLRQLAIDAGAKIIANDPTKREDLVPTFLRR